MKDQIEKQAIEEMAKVIEKTEQIARDAHCGLPSPTMYAKDLYWHGYRKQSEVENYKQIAEYQQKLAMDRYFEIKRLQEDVDRLQDINNRQVEDVRLAKQEVAREIFEEIDRMIFGTIIPNDCAIISIALLAELKKKYTGEKT